MYVVLTTKPGEFRTEMSPGVQPVETYDYIFYGRKRASFTIAKLADDGQARIRIVEDEPPQIENNVPCKLFEKFDTVEDARHELKTLTTYGSMDIQLKLV